MVTVTLSISKCENLEFSSEIFVQKFFASVWHLTDTHAMVRNISTFLMSKLYIGYSPLTLYKFKKREINFYKDYRLISN